METGANLSRISLREHESTQACPFDSTGILDSEADCIALLNGQRGRWVPKHGTCPLLEHKTPATAGHADTPAGLQALRKSQQELRRLSGLLVSIQEDERRRIALDLHDGIGQSLSVIKLSIESAARLLSEGQATQAQEALQRSIPKIKEALGEVRRVSTELRPAIIDDLGILPTLSWLFREFEAASAGLRIDSTVSVAERDIPLPLHISLYRILQEAMHNVAKHAAADRVSVRLERIDAKLHLRIEDNGCGFDPQAAYAGHAKGLGLLSMKERASCSGGTYGLRSAPGQGTCISVCWPC